MDSPAVSVSSECRNRFFPLTPVFAIAIVAAAIRVRGAWNDLWLDEIWSLHLVSQISSPLEVFTKIHHDNNHYLNSLWLYLAGQRGNWHGYRFPAIGAGIGTVIVAWLIGRRRSATDAFFALVLTSFSYALVLYSSEARGYSMAVFFSLLSYYLLDLHFETKRWFPALMSSVAAVLALLSQLISGSVILALAVWSVHRYIKLRLSPKEICIRLFVYFFPVAGSVLALYFIDLRHVVAGGGTSSSLLHVSATALGWTVGLLPGRGSLLITDFAAILIIGTGLWLLYREKTDSWSFYIGTILVFPVLLLFIRGNAWIYVRHFIIAMVFLLILLSFVLASLWKRGFYCKGVCILLTVLYLIPNGWHMLALFKYGRGHYAEAVRFMAANSKRSALTIGGDHDFRIGATATFYSDQATGKGLMYYAHGAWPQGGPEWVVFQKESFDELMPMGQRLTDTAGDHYELVKAYPTAPLSGLPWFLFHNEKP